VTAVMQARVGDVLRPQRVRVEPEPLRDYTAIGVRSFGRGLFHYEPVSGDKLGSLRFFNLAPGRLVVSNIKGWEGAVAVSSDVDNGCIASNRFLQYEAVDAQIDVGWARWFFLSDAGNALLQDASPGSADRNRTLSVKRFENLTIPLPPVEEQARQAAFLDTISQRSQATGSLLAGRGSDLLDSSLPPLVDEVVRRHSRGTATVSELLDLVSDVVHPGDALGPADTFVGLQHIARHTGARVGSDSVDGLTGRKFRFQPGDIVYGYLRPYLNKVWVADRHGLCSVDQYVLRPRRGVNAEIVGHVLRGQMVLDRAIELTHSLQLPRLRSGLLMSLEISVVSESAAEATSRQLTSVREYVVKLAAARSRQVRASDALIPAALNHVLGKGQPVAPG
jgi:type I restriction enzyme S subunit